MHIAIIGAGFPGLAAAYHLLLANCRVTLFDPGFGKGASGISTGLLHPYPGEQSRRTWKADEALAGARYLLQMASESLQAPVANFTGIVRYALNDEQKNSLLSHSKKYKDIEEFGENSFLITSGATVYSSKYLEGLWQACKEKGAKLEEKKISNLQDLSSFDQIILAGGAGVLDFPECKGLPVSLIKGQILKCKWPVDLPSLERSMVGKGYLAKDEFSPFCHVGATYEREFSDLLPNKEKAILELKPKISSFFPHFDRLSIVECRAGVRVARRGSYLPLVGKLSDKIWLFGAMGSRGLLYHGYLAELLSHAIVRASLLPKDLHCSLFKNSVMQ